MKKLFTLILVLVAFAINAKADDRTVITRIEVTSSDYESIVVAGGELKRPSISFTGGSPDPYYRLANFDQGSWRKRKGKIVGRKLTMACLRKAHGSLIIK